MNCSRKTIADCRLQIAEVRPGRRAAVLLRLGPVLALVLAGCWLFGPDETPPTCRITAPADSSAVSGVVLIQAQASDTNGVEKVEFYADGALLSTDQSEPFESQWDTGSLEKGSWHRLFCVAEDPSGNRGYSDTIDVQVLRVGGRGIFLGRFELPTGYYLPVGFTAEPGDMVAGDFRVAGSGVLSRFYLFDRQNYGEFRAGRSHSPLIQESNKADFSVRAGVASSDSFYLVFLNTSGAQLDCWVRFVLE